MAPVSHEERFVKLMQFVVGDAERAQELSIPRKARRLDMVCRFTEAPADFGTLQADCMNRSVLFEHESQPLTAHAVASAWVGLAWLLWERVRPRGQPVIGSPDERDTTSRPPLAIVVADHGGDALHGAVPTLVRTKHLGVWATAQLDQGGLYVIDTSLVRVEDGFSWWSWVGRAKTEAEAGQRLDALISDELLPIQNRARLKEAIVSHQLPVSATEHETVAQRLRLEGQREGRREGRLEGQREGERTALLRLIAQLAPARLIELQHVQDLAVLQQAIVDAAKAGAQTQ